MYKRQDVSYELYAKTINIEALTMIDMAGKDIVPAVVRYTGELARAAREVESLGVDASVQKELLTRVNVLLRQAGDALADLRAVSYTHLDHQVDAGARQTLPAAAEREIDVGGQKAGERDMPPLPEFADRCV